MTKRIAHAIEALNSKKTLFQIEQVQQESSDEEDVDAEELPDIIKSHAMSKLKSTPVEVSDRRYTKRVSTNSGKGNAGSFKRRHSLQVGTNWLQEYSQFNMSAIQNRIVQTHKSNAAETASRAYSVLSPSSQKEHSYNTITIMF